MPEKLAQKLQLYSGISVLSRSRYRKFILREVWGSGRTIASDECT